MPALTALKISGGHCVDIVSHHSKAWKPVTNRREKTASIHWFLADKYNKLWGPADSPTFSAPPTFSSSSRQQYKVKQNAQLAAF